MATKHNFIVTALLVPTLIYFRLGDENRLVHYLEGQGYSDVQIEHPDQYHCYKSDSYSYRARSPNGTFVHEGACVFFFFFIKNIERIGKTKSAQG
ncbi:MAG TPA: hypothetical protein VHF01_04830 [Candidatus Acidoferrum sp.]|nr:hypothetical protein [Candidatus Acidoferrum sp.]